MFSSVPYSYLQLALYFSQKIKVFITIVYITVKVDEHDHLLTGLVTSSLKAA